MQATIAGSAFALTADQVVEAVTGEMPEPVRDHFVIIDTRRYPPKQVIGLVTGLDRSDFTTHHARRILQRLGFAVGRKGLPPGVTLLPPPRESQGPHGGRQAEALRPFMGRWVALRGDFDVVFDADTPQEVVAWVGRYGHDDDTIFGVPTDPDTAEGAGRWFGYQ